MRIVKKKSQKLEPGKIYCHAVVELQFQKNLLGHFPCPPIQLITMTCCMAKIGSINEGKVEPQSAG